MTKDGERERKRESAGQIERKREGARESESEKVGENENGLMTGVREKRWGGVGQKTSQ